MAEDTLTTFLQNAVRLDLDNPEFLKAGKVHDWRNYVDDVFIQNWNNLTRREKLIIAHQCEARSDMEEWD